MLNWLTCLRKITASSLAGSRKSGNPYSLCRCFETPWYSLLTDVSSSGRCWYHFLRLRVLSLMYHIFKLPQILSSHMLKRKDPSSCSRLILCPILCNPVYWQASYEMLTQNEYKSTTLRLGPVNHLDSWMDRRQPLILSERRSPTARPLRHPLCLASLSFAVLE